VAVRVNDGEISVHQVQAVLRRQPQLAAAASSEIASSVLEVLIDQELAAQAATANGVDRSADLIQDMQLQRRELLARAYHDRIAEKATGPSSNEIDRYYESNPALFAHRRLYLLQETAVEASASQLDLLSVAVGKARSAAELTNALDRMGLGYSTRLFAQAAEDVPLLMLESLSKADVGDSVLLRQPGGARVFTVIYAHKAPVDRRTATPLIANYLLQERKRQRVGEAMEALRKGARLQYSPAFAKLASAASAPVLATPPQEPR